MLTHEENILLTQVGRGTPCGELLRRYWHPVAAAGEIDRGKADSSAVKILGEELVVYRDRSGNYGLVGEHCPHRLASLAYGRVDEQGIRCPYHGWKFDRHGQMSGAAGGTRRQYIQRPHQTGRLSRRISGRADLRLPWSRAGAAVAALGCFGVGTWQALDRQRVGDRMQLAAADGKFRRSVASVLAPRRHGASGAAGEKIFRAARVHPFRIWHQKTAHDVVACHRRKSRRSTSIRCCFRRCCATSRRSTTASR